ncbi:hypothetical protein [Duganella callida]|uniref:Uncharacterized protein n=1 Tax=Duganella callida TaxID=2561932 RepID=A0A4Y9S5C3_9BURK|nr:hypothetical protein [Duganella callida]TFW16738.1 hypothetical protein E4L98_22555 [Duganella callida]
MSLRKATIWAPWMVRVLFSKVVPKWLADEAASQREDEAAELALLKRALPPKLRKPRQTPTAPPVDAVSELSAAAPAP